MMLTPSLLRILIVEHDRKRLSLWIPLFLLWPLILLLLLLAAPLVSVGLLLATVLRPNWQVNRMLRAGAWILGSIFSLRGLSVNVSGPREIVHIAFW